MHIDLVLLGHPDTSLRWPLGDVLTTDPNVCSVARLYERHLSGSPADAWAFWDPLLGEPNPDIIKHVVERPGDLWHGGLRLGMGGLPRLIDYVAPTWMINRDPDPGIEATSWRISLRACVVKTDVLRSMGFLRREFMSLDAAALEMGHRYVQRGVFTRYIPELVPYGAVAEHAGIPWDEELRFIYHRFGRRWALWALVRSLLRREVKPWSALSAWSEVTSRPRPEDPQPYQRQGQNGKVPPDVRVSVLIPTVDRYPYLRTLLEQLRHQTVKPYEIIVVDQTGVERRDTRLSADFADLPLRVLYQEKPGQCSSRNAGLQVASGDFILFLDDDDEVSNNLIEDHLKTLHFCGVSVSNGVADVPGDPPLPESFSLMRISDVFPTNNTMIRREVLLRSGLFDLAYDRGQRADGDLGMRVYLTGELMVLNPDARVLHHHAPSGGLRKHKARVVTYASSRKYLTHRNLASVWDFYLAMRYFTPEQVKEMVWLDVLGTFSIRGSSLRKLAKVLVSAVCLPHSLLELRRRYRRAKAMFQQFPQIPYLEPDGSQTLNSSDHAEKLSVENEGSS